MRQSLQEFCDSRGVPLRVDRQAGVLRGVKVLGLVSRNGRAYRADALEAAVGLYENAKVNVNHPKGSPLAPRDYQDRIGVIRDVVVRREEGMFADFHFNPKHALAEQLAWDAEHAPENVGFSHNVEAQISRSGDRVVVEQIVKVQGVDLVADPATTRGLFEGTSSGGELASGGKSRSDETLLQELTLERLRADRPDLVSAVVCESEAALAAAREDLDRLRAEEASRQRRGQIRRLLREFDLPDPDEDGAWAGAIVSETFLDMLLAAPSESAARTLVEERARLVEEARSGRLPAFNRPRRPRSRDQYQVDVTFDNEVNAEGFVRAIT